MNSIWNRNEQPWYWRLALATLLLVGVTGTYAIFNNLSVKPTLGQPRTKSPVTLTSVTASANNSPDQEAVAAEQSVTDPAWDKDAAPRVVAEQTVYDFGQMDPHAIGQYTFQVRNDGTGPLRLLDHRSTCKCTVGQFSREPIPPGGTSEITIRWQTQSNGARFEQSATVETNDPKSPSLTFTITGDVRVHVGANPPEFSLPSIRPDTQETATTIVSSQVWTGFTLRNIQSSLVGLEWTVEPTSEDERQALRAVSAQRLTIQLPNDLPQGHFTHWVRFELVPDDPSADPLEYELPLHGKVLRRLAVYGPGIDAEGNLRLGIVPSSQGLKQRLMVKVYDQETELSIEQIDVRPDFVNITLSPYSDEMPNKGLYVMDLVIPPSSPPCSYQGPAAGELSIRFGHPRIPELKLKLHLAVAKQLAESH